MALVNTLNFLPQIFRTPTNQRFTGAVVDQLIQDPVTAPLNGYIGRTFSPTYKIGDNYVPETNDQRKNYQLESSVVVKDNNNNVTFNAGYIDLLKSIENNNGFTNNHQRLFTSESYSYDGKFDYDKFVNYGNYYWIPGGPSSVAVNTNDVPLENTFVVTKNTAVDGYTFSTQGGHPNAQITLARGGIYKFVVNQPGSKFWIQTEPGVLGQDVNVSTIDTRQVYGVTNNGAEVGTVTFRVPQKNAQDFFIKLNSVDGNESVDVATPIPYTKIQNRALSDFLKEFPSGLDGINTQLQNKTFIFINNQIDNQQWTTPAFPSGYESSNTSSIRPGNVINTANRSGSWKINLVSIANGADSVIQIIPLAPVPSQYKIFVQSGKTYAGKFFWKNENNAYAQVPLITANADYMYYQDGTDGNFVGEIKFIDVNTTPINITRDIIGKKGYNSPNGVVFTNGLKVKFDSLVVPSSYANNEYYVEGVGTGIILIPVGQLTVPESWGAFLNSNTDYITINRASQDANPWSRSNSWFHKDALIATATYNKSDVDYGANIYGRRPIIEFEPNLQLFKFGIQHKDNVDIIIGVIDYEGENYTPPVSDAFNDVEGQSAVWINRDQISTADNGGVKVYAGMRIIFANDYDNNVRGKIWTVSIDRINSTNFIRLLETYDDPILAGENMLITGGQHVGKTYQYDGSNWAICQAKTTFNQAPLFDLVDADGYSFSDTTMYPSSNFAGTKLFGYPVVSSGTLDPILNFPLQYQNFNNIGDIVFNNFYDTDNFAYMENLSTVTIPHNNGYVVKNSGLTTKTKLTNWVKNVEKTEQYQIYTKFFDGYVITDNGIEYAFVQLDRIPAGENTVPYVKVYLNNVILNAGVDYEITTYGVYNIVKLMSLPAVGDKIDVAVFTDKPSTGAYYEVPKNLDLNPLNENFETITLGQLRLHYNKLIENTSDRTNNSVTRPLQDSYLKAQGGLLIQHSAPLIYAITFLNDPSVSFIDSITLARKEYTRFKNKFLTLCSSLPGLDYNNASAGVDAIMQNINLVKNSSFPWYYSDMVPQGGNYNTITYTVLNARQTNYELSSLFDNTQLSNRAVVIYKNNKQLVLNKDYTFSKVSPAIIFTTTFVIGDIITIRDYFNTDGCYVPETPSKLGLYPKFQPEMYLDNSYQTPQWVIRGHDGSITPTYGTPTSPDFRDEYLLELERRIYNNIKADYNTNEIDLYDIIPGYFRTTNYTLDEFNQMISQSFLQWVGNNKIDYTSNIWYDVNNSWTWNYAGLKDYLTGAPLQGSWRAIYKYWYDTDSPHTHPWEMLGLSSQPSWWETRYGAAPYTEGNTTLWEDLEAGYIWNNGNSYVDSRFARPGLLKVIPVDSAGNLKTPTQIPLTPSDGRNADKNFSVGEQGPVETAWRRSSDFPYAMQVAVALSTPASYFSTQLDTSRFYRNPVTKFFSNSKNQKINPMRLVANGDTVSVPGTTLRTSGYINWVGDHIKNLGIDPVKKLSDYFGGSNLLVQLSYKVGGFTDKKIISVLAEQTSPGSTNASVIIPDANYKIYLNKSIPVKYLSFSAVIIEKTNDGYSVSGYDTGNPFFNIIPSMANNSFSSIALDNITVKAYKDSTKEVMAIPYGTTFTSAQQVADFLVSYQRHLISQGFIFEDFDSDLGETRNWILSIREFLYWAQQGWAPGTIILLNPAATGVTVKSTGMVIDEITNLPNGSRLLDHNFLPIKSNKFNIVRTENFVKGNQARINTIDGSTICYARINLIQYEHVIIFDNVSDFGDIIYVPVLGNRQYRLKIQGGKTGDWTGALSAPGYIYNDLNVSQWLPNTDYKQGDIIENNNQYFTAKDDIIASEKFNKLHWTQIKLSDIQTGLLPSFGQNAVKFNSIYNLDRPPIDETLQAYSAGLIGFRQRNYFTDLGVSIPTQTKFYQGMIKQKGTNNAVTALTKATFDNVGGSINIYEEWAFRVGEYGDLDRNQYSEFVLDQSVFTTNPIAFTVTTDTYSTANIIVNLKLDANLQVSNVYNASNLSTVSTSLYSNRVNTYYTSDLPTAGYVNLQDINATVYDMNAGNVAVYNTNSKVMQVAEFNIGDNVWVAKDISSNWNIFRVNSTGLTAANLVYVQDNKGQIQFTSNHTLAQNDFIALTGFNDKFDGLYKINSVASNRAVTVTVVNNLDKLISSTPITGIGNVYKLGSVRFPTLTAAQASPPPGGWVSGDQVWIDTAATGWAVYQYDGANWAIIRQQQNKVDINSVNRTFLYNKNNNNILASLDYIDPVKGKILNFVARDIDYYRNDDPAIYNLISWVEAQAYDMNSIVEYNGSYYQSRVKIDAGNYDPKSNPRDNTQQWTALTNNTVQYGADYHWAKASVGKIWWDLSQVRFIDYEQDALIYRLNHWGQYFPGSKIAVYQWVESSVLPSQYVANGGSGTPLYADDSAYSTYGYVDQSGSVKIKYYFWVSGIDATNTEAGKFNSVNSIISAIEYPHDQGVPFVTILRNDTIALHNVNKLLTGKNSVLHIGSSSPDAALIHSEYALVQEGNPDSKIPKHILNKFIDSLAGITIVKDNNGKELILPVPDPTLTPAQSYGIAIRPRQSMFIDRKLALSNYITLVNSKLLLYPVAQRKVLTTLHSGQAVPNPNSGQYKKIVADQSELSYINTTGLAVGYQVLVNSDYLNQGKWAVYQWTGTQWAIPADGTRLLPDGSYGNWYQSYKTDLYWSYADWYDSTYDYTATPDVTVTNNLNLGKLTLTAGQYVKVLNNGNGLFAVYKINSDLTKTLVGIENGTLQISTGTIPKLEMRQILIAMEKEIFIEDLAIDYNNIFFALIKYALSEQKNLDWVFKTSFITARQFIRKLQQFPAYVSDNQNYYSDYIKETKPYRTILREFVVDYSRDDPYYGDITDFDIPPYWDKNLNIYRSPNGEQPYDATTLAADGYSQWNNNHTYKVVSVTVEDPGKGYILVPQITIVGGGGTGATATATINSTGQITDIYIDTPGQNYTSDPAIVINGVGSGARAKAVLRNVYDGNSTGHNLVRSIKTKVKFDRTTYTNPTTFVFWANVLSNVTQSIGQTVASNAVIVLNDNLFRVNEDYVITGNITANTANFPDNVTSINARDFNNANDRIVAFNGNVDLKLVDDGIDYPGVIIDGSTYTTTVYDTLLRSRYSDNLGIDAANVVVDGGAYVDTFTSHAPEELVPGRMFDSLNLTVYDRDNLGFRFFNNMNQTPSYLRISNAATTTLSANLKLTDTTIYVTDAGRLPLPSRDLNLPGVIFINGEKISYYRNYAHETVTTWTSNTIVGYDTLVSHNANTYRVLGNLYAPNIPWTANTGYPLNANLYYNGNSYTVTGNVRAPLFTDIVANVQFLFAGEDSGFYTVSNQIEQISINSLAQIRRGVDGTYTPAVHLVGTRAVDGSLQQKIPGTTVTTTKATETKQYTSTGVVTYGIGTTGNITVNVGDIITTYTTVDQWYSNIALKMGSYTYFNGSSYRTTGNVYGSVTRPWTANTVISGNTYISYSGNTYVTAGNVYASNIKWQPNVVFASNANVYYNGNSFTATGNIYAKTPTWQANTVFTANTYVYYANVIYTVNSGANVYGSYFANISSNLTVVPSLTNYANISSNVSYLYGGENSGFNTIKANARIITDVETAKFGNLIANGNVVYQFDGNTTPSVILRSLDNVTNQKSFGALIIGGTILGQPDFFDGNVNGDILFDTVAFDNSTSIIHVNDRVTNVYLTTATLIGNVDSTGHANVYAGTTLGVGTTWYNRGLGSVTDGQGLNNSITDQATFLKAGLSYTVNNGFK